MTHNRFFGKVAFTALAILGTLARPLHPGAAAVARMRDRAARRPKEALPRAELAPGDSRALPESVEPDVAARLAPTLAGAPLPPVDSQAQVDEAARAAQIPTAARRAPVARPARVAHRDFRYRRLGGRFVRSLDCCGSVHDIDSRNLGLHPFGRSQADHPGPGRRLAQARHHVHRAAPMPLRLRSQILAPRNPH
jgi:hypothetical protein